MKYIGKEGVGHARMGSGKENVNATVITRLSYYNINIITSGTKQQKKHTRAMIAEFCIEPLCQIYNAAW